MRKIVSIILCMVLIPALLTACGRKAEAADGSSDDRLRIVSVNFPGYDFVRAVTGGDADLHMLITPGMEAHSFDPTPQDILQIQNCDLFIYTGGESDSWTKTVLGSMDTSGMHILSMMDLVETVKEEIVEGMQDEEHAHGDEAHAEEEHEGEEHIEEQEEHAEEEHEGEEHIEEQEEHAEEEQEGEEHAKAEYDEHVWTSPVNASIIVQAIADALAGIDAENADQYRTNCAAYLGQLETLHTSFQEVVQNASRDTLLFGDRFPFRYFADEYGLKYYAAFPGCSTETEASAKTVAFLIDKVKAEEIPVVCYLELSNQKLADTICEGTQAQKRMFHSCEKVSKSEFDSGKTYLDLMEQNLETLREAVN